MNMNLQELFELARDKSAELFAETQDVSPLWHVVLGTGEHALIATPWHDQEEKELTLRELRRFFACSQVKRYAFICEAWTYTARNEHDAMTIRPSTHPDRREALRIHAEDRDGSIISGHYYILRPERGPAKLSPFKQDDASIKQVGRMAGMLT